MQQRNHLLPQVDNTANDSAKSEQIINEAEVEAKKHKSSSDDVMKEINGKGEGEEPKKIIPGTPEAERLAQAWEKGLSDETRTFLKENEKIRKFWYDMDPDVRTH